MSNLKLIMQGLRYSGFVIFHPFKGFWELKREKKGNIQTGLFILFLLILTFILRRQFTGFILNFNNPNKINILFEVSSVALPFIIWCISNWCITTLVDGEGNLKDIFIATAFAIIPLILLNIPMILISNVITIEESSVYLFFDALAIIWSGFLLLFGIMTIHQFSFGKTVFTIIIAIVGMIVILFLLLLFLALLQQIGNFISLLYKEWTLRK